MPTLLEMGLSNAVMAAVLAVVAAAVGHLCRRPAVIHSLWLLVLLKLVTPPLCPAPLSLPVAAELAPARAKVVIPRESGSATAGEPVPGPLAGEPPAGPANSLGPTIVAPDPLPPAIGETVAGVEAVPASYSWQAVAGAVWLAGSLLWFAWMGLHIYRFQRLLRFAVPADVALHGLVRELARRLGLGRCPSVWLVPGAVSPMVWTLGRTPRLLFPARLLEQLDQEQLQTLLVHELAHLRRRDHWVRFLELAALGLYWWHPVTWWARRELHEAEEQCCDAWVVWTLEGAGRSYAMALLQTVAFFSEARSTLPMAASGIGQVPHLRRRLTMIMQGKTPRSLSWIGGGAVLGLGVLLLPLSVPAQQAAPPTASPRQEKIEILKQAIKILEEQEQAEKGKQQAKPREESPEAAKAKIVVKKLADQVQRKRQELLQAEQKLARALADLSKLLGKPIDFSRFGLQPNPHQGQQQGYASQGQQFQRNTPYGVPQFRNEYAPAKKGSALDQKLDRLLREVDELRRELRGNQPFGGNYQGGGFGGNYQGGGFGGDFQGGNNPQPRGKGPFGGAKGVAPDNQNPFNAPPSGKSLPQGKGGGNKTSLAPSKFPPSEGR